MLRRRLEICVPALERAEWCEDARESPVVSASDRDLAHVMRVRTGGVDVVADGQIDECPDHRRQGRQRRRALDLPFDRHCAIDQLAPLRASAISGHNRRLGQRRRKDRRIARSLCELDGGARVDIRRVEAARPPGDPRPRGLDLGLEGDVSVCLGERL